VQSQVPRQLAFLAEARVTARAHVNCHLTTDTRNHKSLQMSTL